MSDTMRGRGWRAAAWRMVAFAAAMVAGAAAKADTLVPWADSTWKYQVVTRGAEPSFHESWFDDSAWTTGRAPFAEGNCGWPAPPQTPWQPNTDLIARLQLRIDCVSEPLSVRIAIDNAVQVWINGIDVSNGLQASGGCAYRDRFIFTVPPQALVNGTNLIAVRAVDEGGASYFDASILTQTPSVVASPDYVPVFGDLPHSVQFTAALLSGFPCDNASAWQWQRRDSTVDDPQAANAWVNLADGMEFQGSATPTITVSNPTADLAVAYRCKFTGLCICSSTGGAGRYSNEVRIGWAPNAVGWGSNDRLHLQTAPNVAIKEVAMNDWGTVALLSDGTLKSWGQFANFPDNRSVPAGEFTSVIGTGNGFAALRTDGIVVQWGPSPAPNCEGSFLSIRSGGQSAAAGLVGITTEGQLASWCAHDCLSVWPPGRYIDVATAGSQGYAIREGGVAVRFVIGQADAVEIHPDARFRKVVASGTPQHGGAFAIFLAEDGTLWGDGAGPALSIPSGTFQDVSCTSGATGSWHTPAQTVVAVRADGSIVQWGAGFGPTPATPLGGYKRVFAAGWTHAAYALTTQDCGLNSGVEITLQPTDVTTSPLSDVSFAIGTTSPSPGLHQWRKNGFTLADGGRISGADGPVLSIQSVRAEDQGRYDCVVAEGPACQRVMSAVAELSCRPVFQREPSNAMIAGGQSVPIDVEVTGFPTSLQWRKDGVPLRDSASYSGVNTATLWITGNDPNQSGSYDLVAVNACGSTVSTKATIIVTDGSGPACPGDFNGDGGVDGLDLFLFFENWEQGC